MPKFPLTIASILISSQFLGGAVILIRPTFTARGHHTRYAVPPLRCYAAATLLRAAGLAGVTTSGPAV